MKESSLLLGMALACCGGQVYGPPTQADASPMQVDASADSLDAREAACFEGGATEAGATPPILLGVYGPCSSTVVEGGRTAVGPGGSLTLDESNDVLNVEVGKGVFAVASGVLGFAPLTNNDAAALPGQTYGVYNVDCATSTIAAGALALVGSTLIVSLLGEGCQDWISGTIRCPIPTNVTRTLDRPNPCLATPSTCMCGADGWPAFPVGVYGECTGSVPGYAGGKVTLTQSHGVLTAAIDGLTSTTPMNASLQFSTTTDKTAAVAPGQSWVVYVPGAMGGPVPTTMTITSGSLVVAGSTLFVFLGGSDVTGERQVTFHCTAGR